MTRKHKVVAVEVKRQGKRTVVNLLGQTARGTRFIIETTEVGSAEDTRTERKAKLAQAFGRLFPEGQQPG